MGNVSVVSYRQDAPVDSERRITRTDVTATLGNVAAGAAVFVGCLYSLGAVLIAGALRDTGVAPRDALPLIPLPQMLGRGMSALLASPVAAVALLAWGAFFLWGGHELQRRMDNFFARLAAAEESWDSKEQAVRDVILKLDDGEERRQLEAGLEALPPRPEFNPPPRERWTVTAWMVFTVGFLSFTFPPIAAVIAATALVPVLAMIWGKQPPRMRLYCSIAVSLLGLSLLFESYYYPTPLAKATVLMTGGEVNRGRLVAQTGDSFYLADEKGSVLTLPVARIMEARVVSQPHPNAANLFERLRRKL